MQRIKHAIISLSESVKIRLCRLEVALKGSLYARVMSRKALETRILCYIVSRDIDYVCVIWFTSIVCV